MPGPDDQIDPLVQPPQSPADLTPWANAAGVPQMVHALGSSLYNLADMPRQAIQASENYRAGGDYDPKPMVDMVTTLAGGGMPAAEKGAAGVFAGRLAHTADLPRLNKALLSEYKGATPGDIWGEHGWYRGPDKQWRYEIPDRNAQFMKKGRDVGELLSHPELYEAYPDLKKIPVYGDAPSKQAYHQPQPYNESIGLDPKTAAASPMLHELQHAIQWREGFAPGANYEAMVNPVNKWAVDSDYIKQAIKQGVPKEDIVRKLKDVQYQTYARHAGETEARNVQARFENPDLEMYPPWQTESVKNLDTGRRQLLPYGQQIVRPRIPDSPYEKMLQLLGK